MQTWYKNDQKIKNNGLKLIKICINRSIKRLGIKYTL